MNPLTSWLRSSVCGSSRVTPERSAEISTINLSITAVSSEHDYDPYREAEKKERM